MVVGMVTELPPKGGQAATRGSRTECTTMQSEPSGIDETCGCQMYTRMVSHLESAVQWRPPLARESKLNTERVSSSVPDGLAAKSEGKQAPIAAKLRCASVALQSTGACERSMEAVDDKLVVNEIVQQWLLERSDATVASERR